VVSIAVDARKLGLVALATLLTGALLLGGPPDERAEARHAAEANPFYGDGMWIWYVSKAAGGNVNRIARKAHRRGIETLFIKSGDGGSTWGQFSPQLVSALKARGLNVCGWQFVYGSHPKREARVGAATVRRGADCLVIDAESNYEGRYAKASTYIAVLRRLIGGGYPLGLSSFPYADYHPAFPYSVFLGPGAAQYNLPQIYWKTIGDSVDVAYAHTWVWNRLYERQIMPLGQVYLNPKPRAIRRFRKLAIAHGFQGVSWWSWQHARRPQWRAVSRRIVPLSGFKPYDSFPKLRTGSAGDAVVWAQQLLAGGGYMHRVTGNFRSLTRGALIDFQADYGLAQTGTTNKPTWKAMLANLEPLAVRWTSKGAVAGGSAQAMLEPRSARLPARRYEIPSRGPRSPRG
jgi:hypothetical protein